MVDTSVYGKDERCEFWIYGKLNRADTTADQGIKVGMEIAVLKLMDEAPDVGEGIEPVLPHPGGAGWCGRWPSGGRADGSRGGGDDETYRQSDVK